jgi:hypothetical protein
MSLAGFAVLAKSPVRGVDRDRQKDKQTDRQKGRQTDKHLHHQERSFNYNPQKKAFLN